MKKYSIIIIFALLVGLLGFQFLRQNKAEPSPEIRGQLEGVSSKDIQKTVQATEMESEEELKQASAETLWERGDFPERLQIADLDMPLFFEGQISDELKQVILADIRIVMGHAHGYEFHDLGSGISYEMPEQAEAFIASRGIILNGLGIARPKEYRNNFGHVIELGGVEGVVVSEELISAYEEAWEARKKAPEKYESLGPFIEWLNTAPIEELKKRNPYWLFGYDGVSEAYPKWAAEMRESLLPKHREDFRVGHPSILEFTYVDQEVLEEEGAAGQIPVGVTLADGKYIDEQGVPRQQALFLYDGKRWYIAFAPAGT